MLVRTPNPSDRNNRDPKKNFLDGSVGGMALIESSVRASKGIAYKTSKKLKNP